MKTYLIFTDPTKFDAYIELTARENGNAISIRTSHITTVCQAEANDGMCSIISLINGRKVEVKELKTEIFEMIEHCIRKAEQRRDLHNA